MNQDVQKAVNNLRSYPGKLADMLDTYRQKVTEIESNNDLSSSGKTKKRFELRADYSNRVETMKGNIARDEATVHNNIRTSRYKITGTEGELKHSRLFGRVQAQIANGQSLSDVIHSADRDTLDVIRSEAPYYYPGDNEWVQPLIDQHYRQMMTEDEAVEADTLAAVDAGMPRLQVAVNQVDAEVDDFEDRPTSKATFIPYFDMEDGGTNVMQPAAA